MFLAGIWCSVKKPPTYACLAPILEELEDLATNGADPYFCDPIYR